ncbi:unnamed protein product [Ranitomeya imitator]|uniref:Uncharacterized protein n=1 Tax=Ranitomeya imitator TaxID=111125 RepID=A0ABN9L4K7_9NEOB|nr:unnamed protein product [Ranitomeya imitator]
MVIRQTLPNLFISSIWNELCDWISFFAKHLLYSTEIFPGSDLRAEIERKLSKSQNCCKTLSFCSMNTLCAHDSCIFAVSLNCLKNLAVTTVKMVWMNETPHLTESEEPSMQPS